MSNNIDFDFDVDPTITLTVAGVFTCRHSVASGVGGPAKR
jgi:hypothetical protein